MASVAKTLHFTKIDDDTIDTYFHRLSDSANHILNDNTLYRHNESYPTDIRIRQLDNIIEIANEIKNALNNIEGNY